MKNCFYPADILLPEFRKDPAAMKKWACIACDQYTSEPEYWEDAERIVGDAPSALRLILPEIYLEKTDEKVPQINSAMEKYLGGVFEEHKDSMIYLERTLKSGKVRRGLIGKIDLEHYDYTKGAKSLVRATEGTVLERIPPRVRIREAAPVELPHIMILIDDPARTVIEPLSGVCTDIAYDFDLMKNGGHVKGTFVPDSVKNRVMGALDALAVGESPLLFAVGDGNHSLATAKACWEKLKPTLTEAERAVHPARYALCEIVNIHDEALGFEPIYRVVFGVDASELISELRAFAGSLPDSGIPVQEITCVSAAGEEKVVFGSPTSFLPVGTLQKFLDGYIAAHPGAKIDYIHGEGSARKLAGADGAVGFLFRGMEKSELFPTVVADGALPRKTFSMGEADDKRFYIEARRIK